MRFTLFTVIFFSIGWICVVKEDDGAPVDCCTAVSTIKIDPINIVEYCIQESVLCPVRVVRFQTKKNKTICSDPDSTYAKNVMRIVNRRKTTTKPSQKPTMCNIKVMNPPVNTTNKSPGTETETSTSTTVPPTVTTIKTSEPESTRTTVTPAVTTIKTSGPETSTRTTVTPAVTTIKTSGPKKEISKTTIKPTSVSKDNTESPLSIVPTSTSSTTKDCCLTLNKHKPAFQEIVNYRVQETPLCSVRAVLFITVENNKICSSPVEDWVQDYIQNLNRRIKTTDKSQFAVTQAPYENISNYFCLKEEQDKYFCIKQP